MSYQYSLNDDAEVEVLRQSAWYLSEIPEGGYDMACRWNSGLQTALEKLAKAPHRFGFAPENGEWLPEHEIRQMLLRPWKSGVGWLVLFTIDEEQKLVTVLQVRHEHRRWMFEGDAT
jgi:plasmid stabilization system protein ParE